MNRETAETLERKVRSITRRIEHEDMRAQKAQKREMAGTINNVIYSLLRIQDAVYPDIRKHELASLLEQFWIHDWAKPTWSQNFDARAKWRNDRRFVCHEVYTKSVEAGYSVEWSCENRAYPDEQILRIGLPGGKIEIRVEDGPGQPPPSDETIANNIERFDRFRKEWMPEYA